MSESIHNIATQLFALQRSDTMPTILCRRYLPHNQNTSIRWDAGWEGLRKAKTARSGKAQWEIFHDFNLKIGVDGLCMIPDTPNNRKRLAKMEQPREGQTIFRDPVTGVELPSPQRVMRPALYTRVEGTMMERGLVDRLYELFKERLTDEAGEGQILPEDTTFPPDDELPGDADFIPPDPEKEALKARIAELEAAKPAPKAKGKPGRPKKPDPLLAPIRSAGGDV